jgi:uncharacterized protein YciI
MEPNMSRSWIAGIAVASCASLLAFAPFARQDGKPGAPKAGAPAMVLAPNAYVITLEMSKWDPAKSPDQQPGFAEHHANVEKLAKDGVLLVGGPFLDDKSKPTGAMMIVKAENAEAAKKLLADDPIIKNDMMKIGSVRGFMVGAGVWAPPQAAGAPKH